MKKNIRIMLLVLVYISICILSSCNVMSYIYNEQEKKCYSDETNFIAVEATLCSFYEQDGCYYLLVDNMEYNPLEEKDNSYFSRFQSSKFMFNEENSKILRELKIEERLVEGMILSFVSSPSTYDDGYAHPIVSITINNEILLDYDTGYKNLMLEYGVKIE